MSNLICDKHGIALECMGGRSAHRSNWYCPSCEIESEQPWETEYPAPIVNVGTQGHVDYSAGDCGAEISECGNYRYMLWRWWDRSKPYLMMIGLNPSTADGIEDDPTIRRCKRFASDWGYGGLLMTNLFALRATEPKDMLAHDEPIGVDNDVWVQDAARGAGEIVCAWGTNGEHMNRGQQVKALLADYDLKCLKLTKHGHPWHPLYVKATTQLMPF